MPMGIGLGIGVTRGGGAANLITAIFADGTDGFYFDFSKTDRHWQEPTGQTIADGAGENIGFAADSATWRGVSWAAMIAAQPELILNGGFATDTTNWTTVQSASISSVSGELVLASGGVIFGQARQSTAVTAGKTYIDTINGRRGTSASAAALVPHTAAGAAINAVSTSQTGNTTPTPLQQIFVPPGITSIFAALINGTPAAGLTCIFDDASRKLVPGNHGLQATTAAQPKWQTGGLARFDGSDDNLLTTLNPAASFSMMFKGKITSASKVAMGSRATLDTRVLIGTDASGLLAGGVGADSTPTIKGGSDIRGATGVGALVFDASTVTLYWNAASIYSGALNGSPNTSVPLRLGCLNDAGTAAIFADADIYHALAIKKALTAAEIAAITNLWGTS